MNEKLIFWAVIVWMVGMLALGIIAVKEIWKDATSSGNEDEVEREQTADSEKQVISQTDSKTQSQ